jgi:hypothetical protein
MQVKLTQSRPVRVLIASALAAAALLGGAARASAALPNTDSYCTKTRVTANDGFSTYWTAEGVGLVGWRVALDATVYDRCDHGALVGNVWIYSANVKAKGGTPHMSISYATSLDNRWTTRVVSLRYQTSGSGWDLYSINTDNNIGLTRTARITWVKVSSALTFNGVSGAGRREQCSFVSRTCSGYMGV